MTGRALAAALLSTLAGCGPTAATTPGDGGYLPTTVGPGPRYRPPAGPASARSAAGLACRSTLGRRGALHLELFANRHVIVVPAGLGVVGPRRSGAYVRAGRCFYPLVTLEPTGVVELADRPGRLALGDLFAVWGQRLSPTRLAGFGGGRVRAYVGGRAVAGDPRAIRLARHLEIVLEIGGYVPPHRSYRFPGGL